MCMVHTAAQEASRKSERELLAAQNEQTNVKQRGEFAQQQILQLSEQRELLSSHQLPFGRAHSLFRKID